MEKEIKSILAEMDVMLRGAVGPRTRKEYMQKRGVSGRNWHFGLSAEQIIKDKIPANVMGCTGRAKLFCKLAAKKGIKSFVVCTAKYDDWKAARNGEVRIINGHQIIAVEIGGKMRVFDPGRKDLVFIKTNLKLGELIDAVDSGKKEYIVTAVVPGDEFEQMNTYQKLYNLYVSGDMNNPEFKIVPKKKNAFKHSDNNMVGKIRNITCMLLRGKSLES